MSEADDRRLDIPPGFSDPAGLDAPVCIRQGVAWGELDALGHVNHTVFLRWFENARFAWFERVGVAAVMRESGGERGPILVSLGCDYKAPVGFPDTVWASVACVELGRSSMRLATKIWSEQRRAVVAEGHVVIVYVDYAGGGTPVAIPEAVRAAIRALDGEGLQEKGRAPG